MTFNIVDCDTTLFTMIQLCFDALTWYNDNDKKIYKQVLNNYKTLA